MEDTIIEDILKTVQKMYEQKDYQGALKILDKNSSHLNSGLWHYNVGSLYAKLDQFPIARFHFLMAESEGFSSPELMLNQNLVEMKLEIPKYEKPLSTIDYLVKGSLEASQGIFNMFSLLFILICIVATIKKLSSKIVMVSLLSSIFFLGLNYWVQSWNKVVLLSPGIIHEGPSAIFESQAEIPAGVMVVTSREGEWLKVIFPSRFTGWIKDVDAKELK